ncbi:LysR family transcriptional regulator [Variovorax sp. YR216]|uniref:LysR family transcriptional regulator n=1 Tax=Variovorax sp. YR216 TaxID=1882828 RepID=UPI00089470CF|nr:LysR family transcriptional regulator [Variovorax sp. YR216]SEB25311.1 DNA-binding transcriptional regulator, LysR family [Variovorax sp. YR216]
MELNLRDLRYFEAAAQTENLGRAAETIARSQPALTKAIRRLEQTVGGPLFEKAGRGVRLTPVGQVLLEEARRLRVSADEALRHVADFSQGVAGLVRIGSGTVSVGALLPQVCHVLLSQAPKAQVSIEVGASFDLLEHLRQKQLDLVVGLLPPEKDELLIRHPLAMEEVVVAGRTAHPIFKTRRISLEMLLDYPWVLPKPEAPSRQWLEAAFAAHGLPPPTVQIEANSIPLLPQLIAGTDLLSFVSRHTIASERRARLREVQPSLLVLRRELGVSSRSGGYLSPVSQRLLELLKQRVPALLVSEFE